MGRNWLDGLLYGVRTVLDETTELPASDTLTFTGDGVTATYDTGSKRIVVEVPGLAGSISWTTVTGLAASATSPLVIGGSQYIGVTHVRTGATPATTKGQFRATDGVIIAAKIDGTDETVLQTAGSTVQIGDDFGPIIERPADASNWYVEDTDGVRLLASPTAVGVNRRLYLYGGAAKTATTKGHVGLDSTGRLTVYADGSEKTCLVTGDVSGGGWQTGIEVADFGALTPQNIASGGDGSYTIAGKSWTATNTSHAAYLQLDAAGLTGQANNGQGDVMLSIPWATLAPAATLADHDVLILARLVRSTYSGVDNSSGMNLCFGFEPFSAGSDGGSGLPAKALLATVDTQGGTGLRNIAQNYNWGTGQSGVWTGGDAATDIWIALFIAAGGRRFYGSIAAGGSTAPDPSAMVQMMAGASVADTTGPSGAWTPSASHLRLRWSDGGGGSKWSLKSLKVVYK